MIFLYLGGSDGIFLPTTNWLKAWIFIVFHGKKIFVGIPRLCIRNWWIS